tara:strand:- start:736 stop:999 length:264 start_codon:yes stop_codon:yes gene_type:complete
MSKTIVENSSGLSKFVYADDMAVSMQSDKIVIGDPEVLIIGCHNSGDSTLHENVTAPADWYGNMYTFDGTTWAENPDFVDPRLEDGE